MLLSESMQHLRSPRLIVVLDVEGRVEGVKAAHGHSKDLLGRGRNLVAEHSSWVITRQMSPEMPQVVLLCLRDRHLGRFIGGIRSASRMLDGFTQGGEGRGNVAGPAPGWTTARKPRRYADEKRDTDNRLDRHDICLVLADARTLQTGVPGVPEKCNAAIVMPVGELIRHGVELRLSHMVGVYPIVVTTGHDGVIRPEFFCGFMVRAPSGKREWQHFALVTPTNWANGSGPLDWWGPHGMCEGRAFDRCYPVLQRSANMRDMTLADAYNTLAFEKTRDTGLERGARSAFTRDLLR